MRGSKLKKTHGYHGYVLVSNAVYTSNTLKLHIHTLFNPNNSNKLTNSIDSKIKLVPTLEATIEVPTTQHVSQIEQDSVFLKSAELPRSIDLHSKTNLG